MWERIKRLQSRLEAWLRIDASLSAEVRMRARIIYLVGSLFILLQLLNMVSLFVLYGGWDRQHVISVAACAVFAAMTAGLRWTKSPAVFGGIYGALAVVAVGVSATIGSSLSGADGINTPLLPLLAANMAFIAYCGTRRTNTLSALASLLLVAGLYRYSSGGVGGEAAMVLYQRATQAGLAVVLVAVISTVIAELVYRTLGRLEDAVARARAAEAARTDLMNTMNHELRTPLNGIIATVDLVARDGSVGGDAKAGVDLIQRSADSLLGLLDDALDRARDDAMPGADGWTITAAPFSPSELLSDVTELFGASAQAKSLWIGTDGLDALPETMIGDADRLRQVLSNLLGNAVKFTREGGVRIGAMPGTSHADGRDVLFYVQDTGPGIAARDQERIFERFAQTETAAHSTVKGSGLGLPICRELVSAMGGVLHVRSEPGRGATFHFTLRLAKPQARPRRAA